MRDTLESTAEAAGETTSTTVSLLDEARSRLLEVRNERIRPGRDEKILTAWNALMIRGLAIAGRALDREDLVDAAVRAVDFIRDKLVVNGRLLASYKDGRARFNAYLDDHAFLLDAILEILQARWNSAHMAFAIEIADRLLNDFQDKKAGGFYFTSDDHEQLVHRSRTFGDDSLPSGNAIAALALSRLGYLLGEPRYLQAAEKALQAGYTAMLDFPHGHAALITALDEYLDAPEIVVIRGNATASAEWAQGISAIFAPRRLIFAIPSDARELPGALKLREPREQTVAYVCRGTSCSMPFTSLQELAAEIREA